jgi:hypothetical protein
MLTFDPDSRITVEEALSHPYLREFHGIYLSICLFVCLFVYLIIYLIIYLSITNVNQLITMHIHYINRSNGRT